MLPKREDWARVMNMYLRGSISLDELNYLWLTLAQLSSLYFLVENGH